MVRQRRRDTRPELSLRSELHRLGLRFRVDCSVLEGSRRRHDIVFAGARTVVEVRGCFWHSCPEHATKPKANATWWEAKLAANVERDARAGVELERAGWALVVVWEHEDPVAGAQRVVGVLATRRPS